VLASSLHVAGEVASAAGGGLKPRCTLRYHLKGKQITMIQTLPFAREMIGFSSCFPQIWLEDAIQSIKEEFFLSMPNPSSQQKRNKKNTA